MREYIADAVAPKVQWDISLLCRVKSEAQLTSKNTLKDAQIRSFRYRNDEGYVPREDGERECLLRRKRGIQMSGGLLESDGMRADVQEREYVIDEIFAMKSTV